MFCEHPLDTVIYLVTGTWGCPCLGQRTGVSRGNRPSYVSGLYYPVPYPFMSVLPRFRLLY